MKGTTEFIGPSYITVGIGGQLSGPGTMSPAQFQSLFPGQAQFFGAMAPSGPGATPPNPPTSASKSQGGPPAAQGDTTSQAATPTAPPGGNFGYPVTAGAPPVAPVAGAAPTPINNPVASPQAPYVPPTFIQNAPTGSFLGAAAPAFQQSRIMNTPAINPLHSAIQNAAYQGAIAAPQDQLPYGSNFLMHQYANQQ